MISSLALGYITSAWSRARVVFIPKTGKKDITNHKSFRPISLTSFLLKTIEKLVDYRIRSTVLRHSPLQPTQHAYRAGRSMALPSTNCIESYAWQLTTRRW